MSRMRLSKHPTVSAPLDWKEVRDKLDPGKFTMGAVPDRLEKKGGLFENLLN